MTHYGHGLFIGKFYPPHIGHHAGIRDAAACTETLTVLVMASAAESVALADRMAWLRAEHPDPSITVIGIRCDAPVDVTDPRVWAAQVAVMRAGLAAAGRPDTVDAVFCGDDYGGQLAGWFGAVDARMSRLGPTATAVRADLAGHWGELAPATRAGLVTRVVVLGAESTGTTTIAGLLRDHYARRGGVWSRTHCVPEYGREYTAHKMAAGRDVNDIDWTTRDFDCVGIEQNRREERAARSGSPVLICDTDAFATTVWERRYLGVARTDQAWARPPAKAVYLLTDHHDVPWDDDGMREGDLGVRAAMTTWFARALTEAGHSWVLLTGSIDERLALAVRTTEPLLRRSMCFGEPLRGPGFGDSPCLTSRAG